MGFRSIGQQLVKYMVLVQRSPAEGCTPLHTSNPIPASQHQKLLLELTKFSGIQVINRENHKNTDALRGVQSILNVFNTKIYLGGYI